MHLPEMRRLTHTNLVGSATYLEREECIIIVGT